MEKRTRRGDRPFRRVDAMILTAATAVGLVGGMGLRESLPVFFAIRLETVRDYLVLGEAYFAFFGSPMLAAWSAAFVAIRLLPPRPGSRLWLQPGMAAAWGAMLALAGSAAAFLRNPPGWSFEEQMGWVLAVPRIVSLTILAAWGALALARRWRPEPSWIDRLGRVLALAWFANWLAVLHWFSLI